ncbi:hypothetical protein ACFE04_005067 [Oxalis oulophora]
MGQQQSKDELLYQQVNYGNIEGIKSLCSEGAGLEWVDKEGKTALILASMNPELYTVAKTLIDLGANVNAYRPGRHAGTPLHHAAKRGLDNTVRLLLSHGANALVMNDDCQTPLDVAREKGFGNVVRIIENHICLFSGWLREFYGLGIGFLEALAPKLLSRLVWVVILPCGSRNFTKPLKLEMAIYSTSQDAKPRTMIPLWKANLEDPKFNQPDPSVQIVFSAAKTRIKFAPANEGDKQQLQLFCDACKGIPRATPVFLNNSQPPAFQAPTPNVQVQATAPSQPEDLDLALAINASVQSAMAEKQTYNPNYNSEASTSAPAPKPSAGKWTVDEASSSGSSMDHSTQNNDIIAESIPTAPPITDEILQDGPIHYPSIDFGPIDLSSSPAVESLGGVTTEVKDEAASSSCVICLDAPVEGACVPCGHMCGCMSCLEEIMGKKWGCPVCRAKINQVIRLYAV